MQSGQIGWRESVRIRFADARDLVRTCGGAVGHPEPAFAGRVDAAEQQLVMAEDYEVSRIKTVGGCQTVISCVLAAVPWVIQSPSFPSKSMPLKNAVQ